VAVAARWKHKYKQTKGEESSPRPKSHGLDPFLSAPGETR
jgi:hypothetical protein